MKLILLCAVTLFMWQDLPYKPTEEFDIKLDYEFRQRNFPVSTTTVHLDESRKEYERRTSTDLLPYLTLDISLLKLSSEEVRLRIVDNFNQRIYNRKVQEGDKVPLALGFTADVKDRVKAHEFTLLFLNSDKKSTSRIVISVDEDGNFFVNDQKRGRF